MFTPRTYYSQRRRRSSTSAAMPTSASHDAFAPTLQPSSFDGLFGLPVGASMLGAASDIPDGASITPASGVSAASSTGAVFAAPGVGLPSAYVPLTRWIDM